MNKFKDMIFEEMNGHKKEDDDLWKDGYVKAIDDFRAMILTELKYGVGGTIDEEFVDAVAKMLKIRRGI